jgi:hypothetical protein
MAALHVSNKGFSYPVGQGDILLITIPQN